MLSRILKFTISILSLAIGFLSFGSNIPKAQAALSVGQKMGSQVYHTQMRKYLLSVSGKPGTNCNVTPRPSSCLSANMVSEIMAWARDPNGDGRYTDGIIEMPNSSSRLTAMRTFAKKGFHPLVMKEWVIPWEVKWHFTIIPDNLSADDNSSVGDIFWPTMAVQLSDFFPEFRVVGDYQTGDTVVRALAYERKPSGIPGVPPRLVLQAKTKLSATAKDRLYGIRQSDGTWRGGVRRFIPFRYTKENKDWTAEETNAMNNAISFQNSVEERMAKRGISDDPSQNNWNYQISKASVGTWDAILIAANVIPLLKGKKILGLAKTGAETADAVSSTAKITVRGSEIAATRILVEEVASRSPGLTLAESEQAVKWANDILVPFHNKIAKWLPSNMKSFTFWDDAKFSVKSMSSGGQGGANLIDINERIFHQGKISFQEAVVHEYMHYLDSRLSKLIGYEAWKADDATKILRHGMVDYISTEVLKQLNPAYAKAAGDSVVATGYPSWSYTWKQVAKASQRVNRISPTKARDRLIQDFLNGEIPAHIMEKETGILNVGYDLLDKAKEAASARIEYTEFMQKLKNSGAEIPDIGYAPGEEALYKKSLALEDTLLADFYKRLGVDNPKYLKW